MIGVPNKRAQSETLDLLNRFETLYITRTDQVWAMQKVEQMRFSHSIGMNDALIASVAYRLQVPFRYGDRRRHKRMWKAYCRR